jgi:hypothetical protein
MELPPYNEFVALEIPFPYSPLLSQNQTDTHITISLLSLFSASCLSTHTGTVAHCIILRSNSLVSLFCYCLGASQTAYGRGWIGMKQTDICYDGKGVFIDFAIRFTQRMIR